MYIVEFDTGNEWQDIYGDYIKGESPEEAASLFMDWQREQISNNQFIKDLDKAIEEANEGLYRVLELQDGERVEVLRFVGKEY